MSERSDALLAITGVFPDKITPDEHAAAASVPVTFAKRGKAWAKAKEAKPFKYVPPKNLDKLFMQLATEPSQLQVAAWIDGLGVGDAELVVDYYTALKRARDYLVAQWPKLNILGASGPKILPLSDDDTAEVWSLIQVIDDPARILDEMDAGTLTTSQVDAFKTCYPDLLRILDEAITAEMTDRLAKDPAFDLGWEREGVLKTLRSEPPEEPFIEPPAPAEAPGKPVIDPERDMTQAEVSSKPKGGKGPGK